jgi:hypothetical protein
MTKLSRNALYLLLELSTGIPVFAQDKSVGPSQAQVTFYSTGSFWTAARPGYKYGTFASLIFDHKHRLANITRGRFITFSLAPGPHIFPRNIGSAENPKGGAHLKVDLAANQHYYIDTYFKTTSLLIISTPRIEQSTCQDAQEDAVNAKPLESKHIEQESILLAVSETSFPQCP